MSLVEGQEYLLANSAAQAQQRFDALSAVFDPVTFRHIDSLGIQPGWHCWEIGAGGPSVPNGLATRVGPLGRVLATDIDLSWLSGKVVPTVELLEHDVILDDPPTGGFDLIHARLVLVHLPERDRALRAMASALRPGGWLLVEDFDIDLQPMVCPDAHSPAQVNANKVKDAFRALLFRRGVDPQFGRRLPRLLRQLGLGEVTADAYFPLALPHVEALEHSNISQVATELLAAGELSQAEIDHFQEAVASGTLDLATAPLVSASARKPPHHAN